MDRKLSGSSLASIFASGKLYRVEPSAFDKSMKTALTKILFSDFFYDFISCWDFAEEMSDFIKKC